MPKPKGTTGATKMKILAVICHNKECGIESYGYDIWLNLKEYFHLYLNDNDIRNVYHHLYDLGDLGLIKRMKGHYEKQKCLYELTQKGIDLKNRYDVYMNLLYSQKGPASG
jgi:DNA-binding transcriptional ArsR family regulator